MAHAVCASCGQERHWRAGRGARLSDLRCPCGGELRGKTAGTASAAAGRKYAVCALCGRRTLRPYDPGVAWRPLFRDRSRPPEDRTGPCCRMHGAAPVDPLLHPYDPSTGYVGGEGGPEVCHFCLRAVADHGVEGTPCARGRHEWRSRGDCPEACPCVCHRPGGRP